MVMVGHTSAFIGFLGYEKGPRNAYCLCVERVAVN